MIERHIEEIAPGVFARTGARPDRPGTMHLPNSGIVVGDDGVLVVDPGSRPRAGGGCLKMCVA